MTLDLTPEQAIALERALDRLISLDSADFEDGIGNYHRCGWRVATEAVEVKSEHERRQLRGIHEKLILPRSA